MRFTWEAPPVLRRAREAFTSPEVSWWFDAESACLIVADRLDDLAWAVRGLAGHCYQRGRAATRAARAEREFHERVRAGVWTVHTEPRTEASG